MTALRLATDAALLTAAGATGPLACSVSSISDAAGCDRRPDVSVWRGDRLVRVYEAARVDEGANFLPRERQKMLHYDDYGIPWTFEEVK